MWRFGGAENFRFAIDGGAGRDRLEVWRYGGISCFRESLLGTYCVVVVCRGFPGRTELISVSIRREIA